MSHRLAQIVPLFSLLLLILSTVYVSAADEFQLDTYEIAAPFVRQLIARLAPAPTAALLPPNEPHGIGYYLRSYCVSLFPRRDRYENSRLYRRLFTETLRDILTLLDVEEQMERHGRGEASPDLILANYSRLGFSIVAFCVVDYSICVELVYKERRDPVARPLSQSELAVTGIDARLRRFAATFGGATVVPIKQQVKYELYAVKSSLFSECVDIWEPGSESAGLYAKYSWRLIDERFYRKDHFEILMTRLERWWSYWRQEHATAESPTLYTVISTGYTRWATPVQYARLYDRRYCANDIVDQDLFTFTCRRWQLCLTVVHVGSARNSYFEVPRALQAFYGVAIDDF